MNNLLYGNHACGISLYRGEGALGPKNDRIINNTIVMARDARWALNISQGGPGIVAWNNILLNDNPSRGSISIEADSMSGFQSDYNIVVDRLSIDENGPPISLSAWRSKAGRDRHSLVSRPQILFMNAAQGEFHLRADSRAIGAADPAAAPKQDFEIHPRPSGRGPDIGAFERTNGPRAGSRATVSPATKSPVRRSADRVGSPEPTGYSSIPPSIEVPKTFGLRLTGCATTTPRALGSALNWLCHAPPEPPLHKGGK